MTVAEVSTDGGDPVTVLNAASIGTYPQVIAEREDRMDHFGKWLGGRRGDVAGAAARHPP